MDAQIAEETVDRYLSRHAVMDLEAVLALFAGRATLEDPVGTPIHRGRTEIRAFYRQTYAKNGPLVLVRIGPTLCCGEEVAAHVRARLASPADAPEMDVIYTLRLDEEGLIDSLRAYF